MASPKHPQTLRSSGRKVLSAANTNRDGTGTLVDILTGVANGSVVQQVRIAATGTVTEGFIRFFLHDGTNNAFLFEIPVPAIAPAVGRPAWTHVWRGSILLPSTSHILRMAPHNAETFHVVAEGVDY